MISRVISVPLKLYDEHEGDDIDWVGLSPDYQLWPAQRGALRALRDMEPPMGGILPLAVGGGKFMVSVLAATVMRPPPRRPVLLVPASLYAQTLAEIKIWRKRFLILPRLKVLKYSVLSLKENKELFDTLRPDCIIADECHYLRSRDSRTTRSVERWLLAHPETRFVGLSGTITSKTISDMQHLFDYALREGSPMPTEWPHVQAWDAVISARSEPRMEHLNAVAPLLRWAGESIAGSPREMQVAARRAFWYRVASAPGVHMHNEPSCTAALHVQALQYEMPCVVMEALRKLLKAWELPNGEELIMATDVAMQERCLMMGYYREAVWPNGVDQEWLDKRRVWGAYVRRIIARRRIDSEVELIGTFTAGREPIEYLDWLSVADRPGPDRRVVWLTDALPTWLMSRMKARKTIVWSETIPLQDALRDLGAPVNDVSDETRSVALSRRRYGTGCNLQAWNRSIVVTLPPNGTIMEQLLGREHRGGQQAQIVTYEYLTLKGWGQVAKRAVKAIREDADYQDPLHVSRIARAQWS